MIALRKGDGGRLLVLLPVIATFIGDAGAFFAGRAWGKRKMSPKTSPNKTVAGLVGGLAASAVFMTLYGFILRRFGTDIAFWKLAVAGLVSGAAAQLGDLSFSIIKRHFGVKDYGRLLPGHGGAYDRFDSTAFAAPTLLALLHILRMV
jgi:phosphatidate cytidylyltransferase